MSKLLVRQIHRWIGIFIGLQVLLWTVSGLFFSVIPIDEIRGRQLLRETPALRLGHAKLVSPNDLIRQDPALSQARVDEVQIKQRLDKPVYIVRVAGADRVFDAETAEPLAQLTQDEILRVARASTTVEVLGATLITEVPPGSEYRGGELPAWQIRLEGDTALYISAASGQVRAVRTSNWRLYDLLWALHIMDYDERENFNHWWLQAASALAVLTALSGIILFFTTLRLRRAT